MLWIVAAGRPCKEAKFILLSEPPPVAPALPDAEPTCIVVTAAMGSRQAPEVRLLQALRTDLATQSTAGRSFVAAVNRFYYSVSPPIARAMWNDADLRDVIKAELVLPSVSLIRRARQWTRHQPSNTALIAILAIMGLAGILFSPAITLWIAAKTVVRKLARRMKGYRDE
jgi:hypothetical protein